MPLSIVPRTPDEVSTEAFREVSSLLDDLGEDLFHHHRITLTAHAREVVEVQLALAYIKGSIREVQRLRGGLMPRSIVYLARRARDRWEADGYGVQVTVPPRSRPMRSAGAEQQAGLLTALAVLARVRDHVESATIRAEASPLAAVDDLILAVECVERVTRTLLWSARGDGR